MHIYVTAKRVSLKKQMSHTITISSFSRVNNINKEAKSIASDLNIADRVQNLMDNESYITIKYHKEDFPNRICCRLINPSKSEIGKISKAILDRINNKILESTNINQWNNTNCVIEWFDKLNKNNCSFVVFDIENFYPSISIKLFENALLFA